MIIICPNCNANFVVPDEKISAQGKKVKCGKCSYIWHFVPKIKPGSASIVVEKKKEEEETNIPLSENVEKVGWLYLISPLFSLLLCAAVAFTLLYSSLIYYFPRLLPIYKTLDIDQYADIQINSFKAFNKNSSEDGSNFPEVLIEADLINYGTKVEEIPMMLVNFFDKNKNKIYSIKLTPKQKTTLPPGTNFKLKQDIALNQAGAAYVSLELGNELDFWAK